MLLDGIRVLECCQWVSGPSGGVWLADLGADVIKIEPPGGDRIRGLERSSGMPMAMSDGKNIAFEINNYSKRSITLDLTHERGRQVAYDLVEKSDVFVENMRVGIPSRLGIEYERLKQVNPKLVYVSLNGIGTNGPQARRASFDLVMQARAGVMMPYEGMEEPLKPLVGMADNLGGLCLSYAVVAGLLNRQKTNDGCKIDVSMFGSLLSLLAYNIDPLDFTGRAAPYYVRADAPSPLFSWYKCGDGVWLTLGGIQDKLWPDICDAIEMPHLINDPRFATLAARQENRRALASILDEAFLTRTYEEWERRFDKIEDLAFTRVNSLTDLASDEAVMDNGHFQHMEHPSAGKVKMVGFPLHSDSFPLAPRRPAPELGQHTEEVLMEVCGYEWDELAKMRDQGVI